MAVAQAQRVHYDEVLTNVSVKYRPEGYIAERIFPTMPVKKESDLFYVYDLSAFRYVDDTRQDGDTAKQASFGWKADWYMCEQHSLRDIITPRQRENVSGPIDLEVDMTEHLTDLLLLNREIRAARTLRDPANNLHAFTPSTPWDNYTVSSPKTDLINASNLIFTATGRRPNVVVIPSTIARRMLAIEEIKEERRYVTDLTQSGLPQNLWGLEVLEAAALQLPTDPFGSRSLDPQDITLTSRMDEIWGRDVWVGYVDKPGLRRLTYGATFEARQRNVRTYIDVERDNGTWIEVDWIYTHKVIARACGVLIQNVMSAA
jgi:hypothetical protein